MGGLLAHYYPACILGNTLSEELNPDEEQNRLGGRLVLPVANCLSGFCSEGNLA